MPDVEPVYRGPWHVPTALVAAELESYLADARNPAIQALATRCSPWSVRDLTAHLACTFERFAALLERSRRGDLSAPFGSDELARINLAAVVAFSGDPIRALDDQARRFLAMVGDPMEVMAHQFGPIPVGLQLAFGLNELAIHHDDLAAAAGRSYRPSAQALAALAPVWERALGGLPDGDDLWKRILTASGRNSTIARATS